MSKRKIPQSEFDSVLRAVAHFPQGGTAEKIFKVLDTMLPRRVFQRHLATLVKNGHLQAKGRTRNRYYRLAGIESSSSSKTNRIPLSAAAKKVCKTVSAPIQARHPVGYNREFLDAYRPNVSFYLPNQVRKHLFELGKSPTGERPAGTYARHIFNRLLIDLSWNSSRLEGNTYSLLETKHLIELGETAEGKNSIEAQMILNHKAAIEFLVESADRIEFNRFTILNLHALLSHDLLADFACGQLRSIPVDIAKSVYHPLGVPQLINECFQQILDTAKAIKDPFEQAFFVMVHLPYLQPFEDVNKRVSRLAANLPFIRENLCPLSFTDVPQDLYISGLLGVYELNRVELLRDIFVWAYERSCQLYSATRKVLGEPDPLRLRYRTLIMELVAEIVQNQLNKKSAIEMIRKRAQDTVPTEDRGRFIEIAETILLSLHEGNIARFRLRPSEYGAWQKTWVSSR